MWIAVFGDNRHTTSLQSLAKFHRKLTPLPFAFKLSNPFSFSSPRSFHGAWNMLGITKNAVLFFERLINLKTIFTFQLLTNIVHTHETRPKTSPPSSLPSPPRPEFFPSTWVSSSQNNLLHNLHYKITMLKTNPRLPPLSYYYHLVQSYYAAIKWN